MRDERDTVLRAIKSRKAVGLHEIDTEGKKILLYISSIIQRRI